MVLVSVLVLVKLVLYRYSGGTLMSTVEQFEGSSKTNRSTVLFTSSSFIGKGEKKRCE